MDVSGGGGKSVSSPTSTTTTTVVTSQHPVMGVQGLHLNSNVISSNDTNGNANTILIPNTGSSVSTATGTTIITTSASASSEGKVDSKPSATLAQQQAAPVVVSFILCREIDRFSHNFGRIT